MATIPSSDAEMGGSKPKMQAEALVAAWRALYPRTEPYQSGDAGARAALRRAASPDAAMMEPAFHSLLLRMKERGFDFRTVGSERYRRIALVACLLAERKDGGSGPERFLQALGGAPKAEERVLSTLRFQSLMAAIDRGFDEDALTSLRRAMKAANDLKFNVTAFAADLLGWSDQTRIRWTFDYFGRPHMAAASLNPDARDGTDAEETAR